MKLRIREIVLTAVLLFSAPVAALAEDGPVALGVGNEFRLFLNRTFATVIVADPLVVEVRTDDDQSVVIEPLKAGATNLVFIDAHGMVTANIKVSVCGAPSTGACLTRHSAL
jgi:Flp pilus assembly secretin CpaC